MNILALDPATKCGWAHSNGLSGTWDLRVKADESSSMRLIRFRAKLAEMHKVGIGLVVFEASRNSKYGAAVKVAAQLQAVIEMWCHDNEIAYRGYSPNEIKLHATGKGNADKDAMTRAAFARWPDKKITSCDEADALWLLDLANNDYAALASEGLAESPFKPTTKGT